MQNKSGWMIAMAFALFVASVPQPALADPGATGNRPQVALVLGGGGARGFAHVGVIRALEQEKIPIDLIVGTSIGSLIGALYAHEMNSFDLEWAAYSLDRDDLLDDALPYVSMGPVKGERLEAFVKKTIPVVNIENLKIPFAAVATDYKRSTRVVLDRGSLARAIRASCAIPGVFPPVAHQGRLLADGGIVDNLPVSVARDKGADIVIAVNIGQNGITNLLITQLTIPFQAVDKTFSKNGWSRRHKADVLISPAVGNVAMMDFTQKKRLIQAGIHAGQQSVPAIRQAIGAWNAKHDKTSLLISATESAADTAPEKEVGMPTAVPYQPEFEMGDSEAKQPEEAASPYTRISDAKKALKEKKLSKGEYKKIVNRLEGSMKNEIDQAKTDFKADKISKKEYKSRVEAIDRKYK